MTAGEWAWEEATKQSKTRLLWMQVRSWVELARCTHHWPPRSALWAQTALAPHHQRGKGGWHTSSAALGCSSASSCFLPHQMQLREWGRQRIQLLSFFLPTSDVTLLCTLFSHTHVTAIADMLQPSTCKPRRSLWGLQSEDKSKRQNAPDHHMIHSCIPLAVAIS